MTSIEHQNGHLFFKKYDGGKKRLILFHGFGQDHQIYNEWISHFIPNFTVYAFDLFYHGKSTRPYGELSKNEWQQYFELFLEKEQIDRFSLIGFSLGGRFAIATAISFGSKVDRLSLLAPDAIFLSLWFKLATYPVLRKVFKYFMYHPNRLDQLLHLNQKVKLINPYLNDFVKKELGDMENRIRVYQSWNDFKSLGYTKRELFKEFRQLKFEREIILGSKDRIIEPEKILPSIKQMTKFKVQILPFKHHQLVKEEVAKLIKI